MSFQLLSLEPDAEGIAILTIRRPEKLNALNQALIWELGEAFREVAANPEIKALIITGSGEKAFVAGADISELARTGAMEGVELSRRGQDTFRLLETMRKPSVAAINGFALGGGLELALAATIRIGSSNAKLGLPEVKLGIVPGYGGTQRLPRLVGRGRALEMMLSGEPVDATEAHRIGLLNAVVPQADLLETARQWARKVIANGPLAVGLAMEAVDVGFESGMDAGLRFEAMSFGVIAGSADRREGLTAFLEKRKAVFTGK
jgi:enoyl-CoA hydratase